MRKKGVIFLDIDGTLLDDRYQINDPLLPDCIQEYSNKYTFCINSNRALEDLKPVAQQFSIQGLLIGENGVFIYDTETKQQDYLLSKRQLKILSDRKRVIESTMRDAARSHFPDRKVHWENVDTVAALSRQKDMGFNEGDIVILNNRFRKFSVSAHVKIYRSGTLHFAPKEMFVIEQALRQKFTEDSHIAIASSMTFCNILAYSAHASKRSAVEKLKYDLFPNYDFYVIGDEMGDFRMIKDLGYFYTVFNAPEDVKSVASATATWPYAQGVHELLRMEFRYA